MTFFLLALCFMVLAFAEHPPCRTIATLRDSTARSQWGQEDVSIAYGDAGDYRLIRKLGQGSYGEVYLGMSVKYEHKCVIKIFTSKMAYVKMLREILLLQAVCGGPHIMRLYDVIRDSKENHPALVLEYVHSNDADLDDLYLNLSPADVSFFMKELLVALEHVHGLGIIHRDLKPHNVLIDLAVRHATLIDFGLSIFHVPGENKTTAGTKPYEAPEMLLAQRQYDSAVDMWSFGAMLGGLLFRKIPFFPGGGGNAVLENIIRVMGAEGLLAYQDRLGMEHNASDAMYAIRRTARPWKELISEDSRQYATDSALDLLDKILRWDAKDRLTAAQALRHPYFN